MNNKFLEGKRVVLASNSPRRRELMKLLCREYEVIPSQADEMIPEQVRNGFKDPAVETPLYLAKLKAADVAGENADSVVIGCDTVVALDGDILGKPTSDADAKRMLRLLSGRKHRVVSGVCVCYKGRQISFACVTNVSFRQLSDSDIDDYVATGEAADKAGAYGIQGYGALLSDGIDGDFYNVVGFPVSMINNKLLELQEK